MKNLKHTEGTWNAVKVPNRNWWEIQHNEDGECVAEVVHGEYNARLIATAPLLLSEGYALAMLSFQSERYATDGEFKESVDNLLYVISIK